MIRPPPTRRWSVSWPSLRFAWDTSSHPMVGGARQWVHGELPRRFPYVRSVAPDRAAPVLGYTGVPDGLIHVLPFLEGRRAAGTPARTTGRLSWRSLPTTDPIAADIVAVGGTERRVGRLPTRAAYLLPFRIRLVIPLSPDPGAVVRRLSRKDRQAVTRQRTRLDWRLDVGCSPTDFDTFYERFHLPTMRRRHGDATRSVGRQTAYECIFRHGVLFFLTQHGERVAAMLARWGHDPHTLTLRMLGLRDGAEEHYRTGLCLGLYTLILEWAAANGVTRLDLSGCEPFLSKGIFQFKRKFHPEVLRPADHFKGKRLWLQVRRDTPAVRDFLVANPLIAESPSGFVAVYFHDPTRAPRLDYRWQTPGIVDQRLVDLDVFLSGLPRAVADRGITTGGGGAPSA